jgi:hypothetical protein
MHNPVAITLSRDTSSRTLHIRAENDAMRVFFLVNLQ